MMISDDPRNDPADIWGISASPNDGLDTQMWGSFGVPTVNENDEMGINTAPSQSRQDSVQRMTSSLSSANGTTSSEQQNGNSQQDSFADDNDSDDEDSFDLVLTDVCWKLRSGLGKFSVTRNHWERRRVVLSGTKLFYYKLSDDEAALDTARLEKEQISFQTNSKLSDECADSDTNAYDTPYQNLSNTVVSSPNNMTTATPHAQAEPRGVLDLVEENASAQQACTAGAPTVFEVDILVKGEVKWKLCFESPEQGSKWLRALENVVMDDSREHGFAPGDHIIRWDMIFIPPIIWPIQIHGIVLEAGRNCVIIADFGLTSYGKQAVKAEKLQADADDENEDKKVSEAFHKLFPKKQRLNVIALTDPREIRQWTKVNYGRNFNLGSSKKGKLSKIKKFFKKSKKETNGKENERLKAEVEVQEAMKHIFRGDKQSKSKYYNLRFSSGVNLMKHGGEEQLLSDSGDSRPPWYPEGVELQTELIEANHHIAFSEEILVLESSLKDKTKNTEEPETNSTEASNESLVKQIQEKQDHAGEKIEPDWFTGNKTKSKLPQCFRWEHDESSETQSKLPKSDPTKIVLARTNFVLENEKLLPPYHVLFSNSECIAVWCKTGRWSTLQTAVWCHVTAVGNAKTSIVTGMGVAAAHMILVPLIAVGGLAFVTAPLLIYKKSKEKWEEATDWLTEKFWERAPPEVFVDAIRNWSDLAKDEE
mmetsp:Transcript_11958/g.16973  ORF Transcript_11958/g.16973 Transcript_11958/m.16973 type:complete len:706 (-) Transcript_11958:366-2483(-)